MDRKCLPCVVHNQEKSVKDIVKSRADKFDRDHNKLCEEADKIEMTGEVFDDRYEALEAPFQDYLKQYGIEEYESTSDLDDGIYEVYWHNNLELHFVRKLK